MRTKGKLVLEKVHRTFRAIKGSSEIVAAEEARQEATKALKSNSRRTISWHDRTIESESTS